MADHDVTIRDVLRHATLYPQTTQNRDVVVFHNALLAEDHQNGNHQHHQRNEETDCKFQDFLPDDLVDHHSHRHLSERRLHELVGSDSDFLRSTDGCASHPHTEFTPFTNLFACLLRDTSLF